MSALLREQQREEAEAGAASPEQQVAALVAALPAPLRAWVVQPHEFHYCRLPRGELHELGAGAR